MAWSSEGGETISVSIISEGGLVQVFRRLLFLLMLSIVWFWLSAIIIMGETVFWRLDFVETMYANMGTTPLALWTFVFWTGQLLIEGIGYLWVWGMLGWIGEHL